jgi:hypothetical protein
MTKNEEYVVIDGMTLPKPSYSLLYFIIAISITCFVLGLIIGLLI